MKLSAAASFLIVVVLSVGVARAQGPVVFSGTVVDLQGNPRVGVPVTAQVKFQNNNQPFNAFDGNNSEISSGAQLSYNPETAKFYLPIRVANIPANDAAVSLRFVIAGQVISEVRFLSALKSLDLDVVVPDPVPVSPCYRQCFPPRIRIRNCVPLAAAPVIQKPIAKAFPPAAKLAGVPSAKRQHTELRRWTDRSSGKTQVATLKRIEKDKAYFVRENGKACMALIGDLSIPDQKAIKEWLAANGRSEVAKQASTH